MYNVISAVAAVQQLGISPVTSAGLLSNVSIPGRFELIGTPAGASIIIDYAHNGISLSSLLDALRSYHPSRIICLFGSVGGRTYQRRKDLAIAAGTRADLCILTSDNPDNEPPMQIINDIASSFQEGSCPYLCIADRAEAIRKALAILCPGDILVLAGKGHETYQLIAGQFLPFREREIVRKFLRGSKNAQSRKVAKSS